MRSNWFFDDVSIFSEFDLGVPAHIMDLTLGIGFEPVLGGLSRLKDIALHTSMQMVRSNKNNIIYSNNMKTNRNELIRRLLSGLTDSELENLVRVRE